MKIHFHSNFSSGQKCAHFNNSVKPTTAGHKIDNCKREKNACKFKRNDSEVAMKITGQNWNDGLMKIPTKLSRIYKNDVNEATVHENV